MQAKPYLREISLSMDKLPDSDEYPFNIPALQDLRIQFHPDVTFLVGENGAGKSTLIESIALAMGFSSEGGTRNFNLATADTISVLYKYLKIVKSFGKPKDYYFLRAESFYNVATYMEQTGGSAATGGYGDRSLHERSHGEAFMAALTVKLRGKGFYLFDEPEAALSPTRQMGALAAIHQLVQKESQLIIATHSPILLAYPRAKILLLDENGISEVSYEETEHFVITKNFLNNYTKLLDIILADAGD